MRLPTTLGKQLLGDIFAARMNNPVEADQAVAAFQRLALVSDFETAIEGVLPWFAVEHRTITGKDKELMQTAHTIVKQDVLGMAVDAIVGVMNATTGSSKDKLAAAAILNELYGEKELIHNETLTDKLVVNLVGKAD